MIGVLVALALLVSACSVEETVATDWSSEIDSDAPAPCVTLYSDEFEGAIDCMPTREGGSS